MNLDAELERLADDPAGACDLPELALQLARDEYPDLDVEAYLSELDGMAHEAENFVRGDLPARVAGLSRYLFHEMGFRGNAAHYHDPRNSFFNQVLDRRTGIPITLSLVTIAIGTRVGVPVSGVGLPGHFVVKAGEGADEILFDPFHGGRLLDPEQCEQLVARVTGMSFQATAQTLAALPAGLFVRRLLTNLKSIYLREGDFGRAVRTIGRIRQLAPDDLHERRDLGVGLLHTGQPGPALDHLAAYLHAFPLAADVEIVQRMLKRARHEVAQWN